MESGPLLTQREHTKRPRSDGDLRVASLVVVVAMKSTSVGQFEPHTRTSPQTASWSRNEAKKLAHGRKMRVSRQEYPRTCPESLNQCAHV